jgi:hypothetical protein
MRSFVKLTAITSILVTPALVFAQTGHDTKASSSENAEIEHGRYVTVIGGCNDCRTPGYAPAGGKAPLERWLTGDTLGYCGPWGTTYPTNLRLYFEGLSEDQWVAVAKTMKTRPPMPWFSVNAMSEGDLRAMYKFVRSLGPAGELAPQALPPGEHPKGPTIDWPMPK